MCNCENQCAEHHGYGHVQANPSSAIPRAVPLAGECSRLSATIRKIESPTAIMYVWAFQPPMGVTGFGWAMVAIGVLLDIFTYGGGMWGNRDRWRGKK